VIFLNGTTCSGKTTTAKALQAALDGVWIRLGIDDFNVKLRDAIADGREHRETPVVHRRLVLGFHRAAAAYASAGNNLIVDHVLGEDWRLDDCLAVFSGLRVTFVGVHCPLAELERRETKRSGRRAGLAARQLPLVHAHGVYDVEVDSHEMSPEACAQHIGGKLVGGTEPTAFRQLQAARTPRS
jgi:chloramphenicol 3-O phosphotransferase